MFGKIFLAGISTIALSTTAFAQAPANEAASGNEIIVTAQKRAESLQDVPLSISALNDEALKANNATNLESVSLLVPGVQISSGEAKAIVAIRGISTQSILGVAEGAVAIHIDDYYLTRTNAAIGSFLDVNRVEVLKGPQGTLYGRNATAGTINIITNKPTDKFELSASAEGLMIDDSGSGNNYGVKGTLVVNAPLNDAIQTRVAIMKVNRGGYFTGIYPDGHKIDLGNADEWYVRAHIKAQLGDTVSWLVTSDNYWADDKGYFIHITGRSRPDVPIIGTPEFPFIENSRKIFVDEPFGNTPSMHAITSTLEWTASDNLTLRSLTQYRRTKYSLFGEFDDTWADVSANRYRATSKVFSQEFQASFDVKRLSGIIGLYYLHETLPFEQYFRLDGVFPTANLYLNGVGKTDAYAVFGDLTYALTDTLKLTLGGRYSHEKKDGVQDARFQAGDAVLAGNVGPLDAATFNSFTPKVVIKYEPSQDLTLYASFQKGFKSGGFNIGSLNQNTPYAPEKIDAYEAGVKYRAGRQFSINAAAFWSDYKNLQLEDSIGNETVIRNAAKARIKGFEFDSAIRPVENLTINLSGMYLDAKATSDQPIFNPLYGTFDNVKGNSLPRASKYSGTVSASYAIGFANGAELTPLFTASYRSHQYLTIFNNELVAQDHYWWLRASLTYRSADEKWSVALFGDNLTNEYVLTSANPANPAYGYGRQSAVAPPRTFGIRFNWAM